MQENESCGKCKNGLILKLVIEKFSFVYQEKYFETNLEHCKSFFCSCEIGTRKRKLNIF